ncbi:MAG: dihydrofolate reductase [Mariprofundales bacterium]
MWAMDRNRLIGNHGTLPWPHISADMRWFRQQTEGKTIVMGRATFDSIGKALPKRRNIILSHQARTIANVEVIHSIDALLTMHQAQPDLAWMVIGGANLYQQMLEHADRLVYTEIDAEFQGDVWFPSVDQQQWEITEQQQLPANEQSPYPLSFTCANRRR